jgi:hypothetical protein
MRLEFCRGRPVVSANKVAMGHSAAILCVARSSPSTLLDQLPRLRSIFGPLPFPTRNWRGLWAQRMLISSWRRITTKVGYGQPGAGTDLTSDTGIIKLKHQFNDQWSMEIDGQQYGTLRGRDTAPPRKSCRSSHRS